MNDKLTWDEIKQRFPNEWVALVDDDWPDTVPDPLAGVVFAHHPDKKTLFRLAHELEESAVVWTGKKRGVAVWGTTIEPKGGESAGSSWSR